MKHVRRWPLALILAGVAIAGCTTPEEEGDVPDGMWRDSATGELRDDALAVDAVLVAEHLGVDVDTALARLTIHERVSDLVEVVQNMYPDTFGGLYWNEQDVAVAQFKGPAPDDALELLRSSGASVAPELVAYSARELEAMQDDVTASLQAMGIVDFSVAVDVTTQRVLATVSGDAEMTPARGVRQRVSREAVTTHMPQRLLDAGLNIDAVDGPVVTQFNAFGGGEMYVGASFFCTAGFAVASGSTKGMATAGHCGKSVTRYKDWKHGVFHSLTYKNGFVGNWGDFGWFTTSGSEFDDFYFSNTGSLRDVTGVRNSFAAGDPLSWYGRKTRQVASGKVKYPNVTAGTGRLVCMDVVKAGHGDSGGPVYAGNIAAGFISGGVTIGGALRMCFSQARYIDDAIGVSIMQ